jgi:hypothetical protein
MHSGGVTLDLGGRAAKHPLDRIQVWFRNYEHME